MYTEERYIIHVKDRSSVGVGFPKPFYNESDFMDYEDEVWCFKSPDFIIRKRIAYNTNADSIVINYARKRSWSISVSDLSDTWKAQRVLAKVSGKPFTEYVRENIFTPAGMEKALYFDPAIEDQIPNMAHGYEYEDVTDMPEERVATADAKDAPKNWYEYDYGEETFFATKPDGGIYTSTHEFAQWEKALRNNTVMSEESRNLAHSPKTYITGSQFSDYQNRENTWYGYGWFIEPKTDTTAEVIYHTGDNGGFKILAARYPESNALVLIFANRADWDRYEVMQKIEEYLGL